MRMSIGGEELWRDMSGKGIKPKALDLGLVDWCLKQGKHSSINFESKA